MATRLKQYYASTLFLEHLLPWCFKMWTANPPGNTHTPTQISLTPPFWNFSLSSHFPVLFPSSALASLPLFLPQFGLTATAQGFGISIHTRNQKDTPPSGPREEAWGWTLRRRGISAISENIFRFFDSQKSQYGSCFPNTDFKCWAIMETWKWQ